MLSVINSDMKKGDNSMERFNTSHSVRSFMNVIKELNCINAHAFTGKDFYNCNNILGYGMTNICVLASKITKLISDTCSEVTKNADFEKVIFPKSCANYCYDDIVRKFAVIIKDIGQDNVTVNELDICRHAGKHIFEISEEYSLASYVAKLIEESCSLLINNSWEYNIDDSDEFKEDTWDDSWEVEDDAWDDESWEVEEETCDDVSTEAEEDTWEDDPWDDEEDTWDDESWEVEEETCDDVSTEAEEDTWEDDPWDDEEDTWDDESWEVEEEICDNASPETEEGTWEDDPWDEEDTWDDDTWEDEEETYDDVSSENEEDTWGEPWDDEENTWDDDSCDDEIIKVTNEGAAKEITDLRNFSLSLYNIAEKNSVTAIITKFIADSCKAFLAKYNFK